LSQEKYQSDEDFFATAKVTQSKSGGPKKQIEYRRSEGRHLDDPIVRSIRVEKKTTDAIILHWAAVWQVSYSEAVERIISKFNSSNSS
jgi:hypothetical protein